MLSLVRGGPRILLIESEDPEPLEEYLHRTASTAAVDLTTVMDVAGEESTLIFLSGGASQGGVADWTLVFSSIQPPEVLLCGLITEGLAASVRSVCCAPGIVLVRLLGEADRAIDRIQEDLKAQDALRGAFATCSSSDPITLIYFTQDPLNRPLSPDRLLPRALSVPSSYSTVLPLLRGRMTEYLNLALGTSDWNDVEIRIYDVEEEYERHRRRALTVIEGLELGTVLGEGWGRDQAFILMSVQVFRIRLFTPFDAHRIKEIAMGLEYDATGRRICDVDVYFQGKRTSWTGERQGKERATRNDLGLEMRNRILAALSPEARAAFEGLDPPNQ
jgi:hypothetical protein